MISVRGETGTLAWEDLVSRVYRHGTCMESRNGPVVDAGPVSVLFPVAVPLVANGHRAMNYRAALGETAWILSGSNSLRDVVEYLKAWGKYSDNGYVTSGAYGPALRAQLDWILGVLREDPGSRRAAATIWQPRPWLPSKDVPCTIALTWRVVEGKLNCVDFMRSSDIWLGLPYDMAVFALVTEWLAYRLGVAAGSIEIVAASGHLYTSYEGKIRRMTAEETCWPEVPFDMAGIRTDDPVAWLREQADGLKPFEEPR